LPCNGSPDAATLASVSCSDMVFSKSDATPMRLAELKVTNSPDNR
jgi:hypothetical protein